MVWIIHMCIYIHICRWQTQEQETKQQCELWISAPLVGWIWMSTCLTSLAMPKAKLLSTMSSSIVVIKFIYYKLCSSNTVLVLVIYSLLNLNQQELRNKYALFFFLLKTKYIFDCKILPQNIFTRDQWISFTVQVS